MTLPKIGIQSALFCLFLAAPARAVLQPTPGGIVVPTLDATVTDCSNKNVQNCLDLAEGQAGLIAAQADALVAPETFQPTCTLTFTPIVKGGTDPVAFGWYNVTPDTSNPGKNLEPGAGDLYAMMVLPEGWGTRASFVNVPPLQLDLNTERTRGHYRDGQIGFWLADKGTLSIDTATGLLAGTPGDVFFTEHAFNPGSSTTKTYYQVLTWQSVAQSNAFYFGWEDLAGGGDNDFDDLLFRVSGIQCSGGGQACDTGKQGVCAAGTMQCQKGALTCTQNQQSSAETCNALDDNCDGQIDEGDLCGDAKVCDRGRCVPRCGTGEFSCSGDEVCTDKGLCVESACATKQCPAGQVCEHGACKDACGGVTCPFGRVCRSGACVDPCAGITCDPGFSCVLGVCQSCECTPCGAGQTCSNNTCVDSACTSVTCTSGTHCAAGQCIDDCQDAKCPVGQACSAGQCVPSGSSGGAAGAGGSVVLIVDPGAAGAGGTGHTGGASARVLDGNSASCACTLSNRSQTSSLWAAFAALGAVVVRRRRTR